MKWDLSFFVKGNEQILINFEGSNLITFQQLEYESKCLNKMWDTLLFHNIQAIISYLRNNRIPDHE